MNGRLQEMEALSWADMLPDALAKIFSRLSLEDMLTVIPRVCRSWRCVAQDSVCWQIINLDSWSRRASRRDTVERMIKMLVNRSRSCLREFSIFRLATDDTLRLVAQSRQLLRLLHIPYSEVTDDCVCQMACHLCCITSLDISGCVSLSKVALEAIGKHCKSITHLKRNMLMYPEFNNVASSDDEAFAIAQYMPQLKHLELAYGKLSNTGLKAILEKCVNLKYLDLRGCWHLDLEETFIEECQKRFNVFHEPVVEHDIYNTDESDLDVSDYDDYSDYSFSDMSDADYDEIGMDMHEEEINGTLYFWPDSYP